MYLRASFLGGLSSPSPPHDPTSRYRHPRHRPSDSGAPQADALTKPGVAYDCDRRPAPLVKIDWQRVLEHIPPERRASVRAHVEEDPARMRAVAPSHPLVTTGGGFKRHLRFKADPLVSAVFESCPGAILRKIAESAGAREISRQRLMQFHRNIGYSLDGFCELFFGE